jgi:glycosyltransferase involved in cell wall biosynthesis
VIAFRHGSVPEILEDGLTGFVVDTPQEAASAVGRLNQLFRPSIRARFEERFSAGAMAREYLRIYRRLVQLQGVKTDAVEAA